MESLIALIIIAVLATIGIAQYTAHRESVLDKEAIANLKLIQSAERIYKMEAGIYIACTNTGQVNTRLRLLLPSVTPRWNYKVDNIAGTPPPHTFRGKAERTSGTVRYWCIDQNTDEPYNASGGCSW